MMTFFAIIFYIIIGILSIVGYFTVGFFVICISDGLDVYIRDKYIKYLVKQYPDKYYFEDNRYWHRTSPYTAEGIYDDTKVSKVHDIVSWFLFIFWPIDLIYKLIILIVR